MNIFRLLNKKNINIENKNSKYQYRGLTLIEMIVSLAVVMFVAAIFIFNYRDSNKRTDLIMASQVMVSDIHRAQNNSLGLLQYGEEVPSGGWGVYFDLSTPDRYIVFPDLEAPEEDGYREYNPNTEGDISKGARVIELAPEIEISNIFLDIDNSVQKASVTFLPPDPRTNIYSGGSTANELYIDIKDLRSGTVKTMLVNFLGLAEIIN
jgi:type II secretory pathway pseudopilin PulG